MRKKRDDSELDGNHFGANSYADWKTHTHIQSTSFFTSNFIRIRTEKNSIEICSETFSR